MSLRALSLVLALSLISCADPAGFYASDGAGADLPMEDVVRGDGLLDLRADAATPGELPETDLYPPDLPLTDLTAEVHDLIDEIEPVDVEFPDQEPLPDLWTPDQAVEVEDCGDGGCCVPETCVGSGLVCGTWPDGCGGEIKCGTCVTWQGSYCTPDGQCACVGSCEGKDCGSDGCGGFCGQCPLGTACSDAHHCAPIPCYSDYECNPLGMICDPLSLVCVDCVYPWQCGGGDQFCLGGACVDTTPCDVGEDCPPGQGPYCAQPGGYCTQCLDDGDCGELGWCDGLSCHQPDPCDGDEDCGVGVCDPSTETCVDCLADGDCPDVDDVCTFEKQCKPFHLCSYDSDCWTWGMICDHENGLCEECVVSWTCPQAYWCKDNHCVADVCAAWETACVDGDVLQCEADGSGWKLYDDCNLGETCQNGVCVWDCVSDPDCIMPGLVLCSEDQLMMQVCVAVTVACLKWDEPVACPEGSLCINGGCQCMPSCDGKECGSDGCGGSCGLCDAPLVCSDGVCALSCDSDPDCTGPGATKCLEGSEAYAICGEVAPGCFQWVDLEVCPGGEVCLDGECLDVCLTCLPENHEICVEGACVCDEAAGYHLAADGVTCTNALCDPNPCNVALYQICVDGACVCDEENGFHLSGDGVTCTQDPCDPNPCDFAASEICLWAQCVSLTVLGTYPGTVRQGGLFELTMPSFGTYSNLFDPGQISVRFTFTAPSGAKTEVNGFLFQAFSQSCGGPCGVLNLTPTAEPKWMVRFSPEEPGTWIFVGKVEAGGVLAQGPVGQFSVVTADLPAVVGVSETDPTRLATPDGAAFVPSGINAGWGDPLYGGNFGNYDALFSSMKAAKMNATRLVMVPASFALEVEILGRYRLQAGFLLDYALERARRAGVRAIVVLDSYESLVEGWSESPYNAANGGPCETPESFWSNPQARALFKRRLQYVTARWGYSSNVLAWELWREVDRVPGADDLQVRQDIVDWHQDMTDWLAAMDPRDHLVTTSLAWPGLGVGQWNGSELWSLDGIDLINVHLYDLAPTDQSVTSYMAFQAAITPGKPHLVTELAVSAISGEETAAHDPNHYGLHNGIWGSLLGGGAGAAMSWWWNDYITDQNLFGEYGVLAAVTAGLPWIGLTPAQVTDVGGTVVVHGRQAADHALLWVKNPAAAWCCPEKPAGDSPDPVDVDLLIEGLAPGPYRVEWRTSNLYGAVIAEDLVQEAGAGLAIARAGLVTDWAVKIHRDGDMDEMPDWWEAAHGLNPEAGDGAGDLDGDGVLNGDEYLLGLDPSKDDTDGDGLLDGPEAEAGGTKADDPDSDGDGMDDGWELAHGLDPTDPTDADLDPDGDGRLNWLEWMYLSEP